MVRKLTGAAAFAAVVLLVAAPRAARAQDDLLPGGNETKKQEKAKEGSGKEEPKPEKKSWLPAFLPKIPKVWPENSCAGHWNVQIGIGTGVGLISGRAYPDNPKTTDVENDGPKVTSRSADTGALIRWGAAYVWKNGWGAGLFARLQISNGQSTGYDTKYDAWIVGLRVYRLVYVRKQLNILPFLAFGYGKMRHVVKNVILPKGPSGEYYRVSGNFDAGLGVQFLYRFTPVFGFHVDIVGDIMFPVISLNLDAVIGLTISY